MQNFETIVNVINTIKDNFGDNEFTNKEWEAVRDMLHCTRDWQTLAQTPTIQTLRKNGLVKVSREEHFTIEKVDTKVSDYACNMNGAIVMEWRDYAHLPKSAKAIIDNSQNGGYTLEKARRTEAEKIEAVRYYYRFDTNGIEKLCKALTEQLNNYSMQMAKLDEAKASLLENVENAKDEMSRIVGMQCVGVGVGIIQ